jgi:hypothetical protein
MKAKIDKDGFLWVERAGKMRKQICPYRPDRLYSKLQNPNGYDTTTMKYYEPSPCGDWCPQFNEGSTYVETCACHDLILDADER